MKKIISVILLIKSVIFLYSSYMGISYEEYFEILNLKLNSNLYYIGLLVGAILFICSFGIYKCNKYLLIITKWIVMMEILYLTSTTLYTVYSFLFLSYIGIDVFFAIFIITIIVGYFDFYILKQLKTLTKCM